jgi:hypothetical protein
MLEDPDPAIMRHGDLLWQRMENLTLPEIAAQLGIDRGEAKQANAAAKRIFEARLCEVVAEFYNVPPDDAREIIRDMLGT